ncbi:MAG TPA: hypothetical protein VFY53_00830, partial [Rhodoplanes sp.]|nr:hypothetical protein [Rhodoplanes sp.]
MPRAGISPTAPVEIKSDLFAPPALENSIPARECLFNSHPNAGFSAASSDALPRMFRGMRRAVAVRPSPLARRILRLRQVVERRNNVTGE